MKSDKNRDITIRYAVERDRTALYRLWQSCFHDSDAFTDYYFDTYFRENRVLMLEEDGKLRAMLHLNPYTMAVGARLVDSYYIVGVATDENYRHRGAMTRLLKKVFADTYDARMPFVYLMPADEAIYRPFEFACIYAQRVEKKRSETAGTLTIGAEGPVTGRPAASVSDWKNIAAMANGCLSENYDWYTWRDGHYFERLQKENQADGGDLLMLFAENTCIGYLSYAMEQKIEVREIFCESRWRQAAAEWFGAFFAEAEGEVLPLAPEGFLQGEMERRPIIMGRIVDLTAWMAVMPVAEHDFSICLKVNDSYIEANNGTWQWQVSEDHRKWRRTDQEPDISLSIDGLMQWMTGYRTVDELEASGRMTVETDCRDVLKKIPVCRGLFVNEIV